MTSIRRQILVNGQAHFIEVNSSLDLDEVEVTGLDPSSGKVVQVSLSPLLKPSQKFEPGSSFAQSPAGSFQQLGIPPSSPPPAWTGFGEQTHPAEPSSPALNGADAPFAHHRPSEGPMITPMDMFSEPAPASQITPPLSYHSVPAPPSGIFAAPNASASQPAGPFYPQSPASGLFASQTQPAGGQNPFSVSRQAPSIFSDTPAPSNPSLFAPRQAAQNNWPPNPAQAAFPLQQAAPAGWPPNSAFQPQPSEQTMAYQPQAPSQSAPSQTPPAPADWLTRAAMALEPDFNRSQQEAPASSPASPPGWPAQAQDVAPDWAGQAAPSAQPTEQTLLSAPPAPSQGLEALRQKSEKEEVDDTLNGMYRY